MQIASGTVVQGDVVLNGACLPDGTAVTVDAQEPGDAVRLPPQLQPEAIDEADREQEELFVQLKQYR